MNIREACGRIWEGYKLYAGTAFVMRKGVELVGLTRQTDPVLDVVETYKWRGESILEHQARTAWLYSAFVSNFSEVFAALEDYLTVMLNHDAGEIAVGDIPDNGNPLHDQKDDMEFKMFQRMTEAYAAYERRNLEMAFKSFQTKDTFGGKILYAVDKIEAILHLLYLELYDHYGTMSFKMSITESDRKFMRFTGSICATDCWAAHTKLLLADYPVRIRDPIFELLDVAVCDVRGESFEWWDKDIHEINNLP